MARTSSSSRLASSSSRLALQVVSRICLRVVYLSDLEDSESCSDASNILGVVYLATDTTNGKEYVGQTYTTTSKAPEAAPFWNAGRHQ